MLYTYVKPKRTPLSFFGKRLREWCLNPSADSDLNKLAESGQNVFDEEVIEKILKDTPIQS